MGWALFKGETQVSKVHPVKDVVYMEAYQKGAVIHYSADFIGDKSGTVMCDDFSIREVQES